MRVAFALLGCALASACAKAPDTSPSTRPSSDTATPASHDAGASADGGHAFGLPMPQQYPHFVWDAAVADAAR
jgi:hypothetical protein